MLSLVSGNALKNFSIFALGVSPYHRFYCCPKLLQMDILQVCREWGKQGEVGRKIESSYSLYCSSVLAFVQSIGITTGFNTFCGAQD